MKDITPQPTVFRTTEPITPAEYRRFQEAYDFFNRELWASSLPNVLVTLQRRAGMKGYFSAQRFTGRQDANGTAHELALNPDTFTGSTDEEILSTLARSVVHVWQHIHGIPSRGGYHNAEWADEMERIGLGPSSTGRPGGRRTGQRILHYIVPGGRFEQTYERLRSADFHLNWQSAAPPKQAKSKAASKTKFTCPGCDQNAWAKADAELLCGRCDGAAPDAVRATTSANCKSNSSARPAGTAAAART
jgi:hypothetical protein